MLPVLIFKFDKQYRMEIIIFIITLVAAFIFSLGGIGAAIILIPILVSFGIPINSAKPIALFSNMISLAGATVSNIKNKRLDFKTGIPIIIFSFLFAIVGAYISQFIQEKIIIIIFILFLLFSSFMFLFFKKKKRDSYRTDRPYFILSLIGAFAGLLAGLLGIGGGSVISPLMLMLGFNPKKIVTITAFVVPFSALSGFLTYWAMGSVNWRILIIVSSAAIIGATAGTIYMQKKLDANSVKKILAIILLIVAAKLIFKII